MNKNTCKNCKWFYIDGNSHFKQAIPSCRYNPKVITVNEWYCCSKYECKESEANNEPTQ